MLVKRPITMHSLGVWVVAFPPQKFALSNVRITVSSLRCPNRELEMSKGEKYSRMDKRATDKLLRSPRENGGG